jgi:hypothetical protein
VGRCNVLFLSWPPFHGRRAVPQLGV